MNCYDFDKTIYKKDCSISLLFFAIRKKPILFFWLFWISILFVLNKIGFMKIETFKEKYFKFLKFFNDKEKLIQDFWGKEQKNIAEWYQSQKRADDVICSASPEFLILPIMKMINPEAKVFCSQINLNTLKFSSEACYNLKGKQKAVVLKSNGYTKFDAVYTDSLSDFPMFDMTDKNGRYLVTKKGVFRFGNQKLGFFEKLKYLFKMFRVKHYLKNCLIILPLFFSGCFTFSNNLLNVLFGFIAFCMMSSFVYILNDLFDMKKDRNHSKKRARPIASFMVKPYEAIIIAVLLLCGSLTINLCLLPNKILTTSILLGYALLNLLYSVALKKIPIVDVFVLAFCYLIRLFYGGAIVSIFISKWFYLTVLCAALYMGLGKRRNELSREKEGTRSVTKFYNYKFLDKNLYVCMALTLVFYSLWAIDIRPIVSELLNGKLMLATIPLVYFILMRYSLKIEDKNSDGDPVNVALKDFVLVGSIIIYIAMIILCMYCDIPNFLKY